MDGKKMAKLQIQWLKIDYICNHGDIALSAAFFGNLKGGL